MPGVLIAATLRERLLGVAVGAPAVLLKARRVHGRRLVAPLVLIGIDEAGVVVSRRVLPVGGKVKIGFATWILELPIAAGLPDRGARLEIYARPCDWETRSLRNPNRQPG